MQNNTEAGNSLNAFEREPVPSRVLNPKAYGVQGFSPGGGCGGMKAPPKKKIKIYIYIFFFFKISNFFFFQIYMKDPEDFMFQQLEFVL